jgi:sterol desaturase/sphingolipid hydroxylase (fatty acid hydroxylase superfamily)
MNFQRLEDWQIENWTWRFIPIFSSAVILGLEGLSQSIPIFFSTGSKLIPVKGKHLDEFSALDHLYISINKVLTVIFTYHVILFSSINSSIKWDFKEITLLNTVGSVVLFFIVYDFFYMIFHRVLHLRSIYPYVHKHHHRQKAPTRGNSDAINVHPFEYIVGEYIHLLAIYLIPCHIWAVAIFILSGGIFASLNHTRFDIDILSIYSVKAHDVHHRITESNYAQYTMFWDKVFGTHRSYSISTDSKK